MRQLAVSNLSHGICGIWIFDRERWTFVDLDKSDYQPRAALKVQASNATTTICCGHTQTEQEQATDKSIALASKGSSSNAIENTFQVGTQATLTPNANNPHEQTDIGHGSAEIDEDTLRASAQNTTSSGYNLSRVIFLQPRSLLHSDAKRKYLRLERHSRFLGDTSEVEPRLSPRPKEMCGRKERGIVSRIRRL